MPLRMFKLRPGEKTRYQVSVPAVTMDASLYLEAFRPSEGLSVELELRLLDSHSNLISHGRAQIADGYLAVISEVERQLRPVFDDYSGELWFELHLKNDSERGELQY
ncbi:MAG: hypothetical protein ACI8TQ_000620 [Planctomycetota bacterium]|jgi:hypothetical protein